MKRVAFGILAVLLGAGCALETGDPGGTSQPPSTVTTKPDLGSSTQDSPEPSPWVPNVIPTVTIPAVSPNARKASTKVGNAGSSQGSDEADQAPEPAPWNGSLPGDPNTEGSNPQQPGGGAGPGVEKTGGVAVVGPARLVGTSSGQTNGL